MKQFMRTLVVAGILSLPFTAPALAVDGITNDTKASDVNLKSSHGASDFFKLLGMNSGG